MRPGLLETLRVRGTVHGHLALTAPWGARLSNVEYATFYLVTTGSAWLELDGAGPPLEVTSGSFVFVRRGQSYVIRDSPSTPAGPVSELLPSTTPDALGVIRGGGGGALTTAVFGCFSFEDESHPLMASFPSMLHLQQGREGNLQWVDASLRLMALERASTPPGAFVSRLAEALLIQVLRAHLEHNGEAGWVGALVDPRVARALSLVHERPAEPWTVGSLATASGMSRTVFATRFASLVGEPPLRYLAGLRMRTAARLLRSGDMGLSEVAARVGYDAEAAFSRAFRRWAGVPPGAFRKGANSG